MRLSPLATCFVLACGATPALVEDPDSGEELSDAGEELSDAGDRTDAGEEAPDAGEVITDAGEQTPDAGDVTPDAGWVEPPLWDTTAIRDPATADCSFTNERRVTVSGVDITAWNVSYTSWESIDGTLQPITIRGFAARPTSATANVAGVVWAHGLGGFSELKFATQNAARTNTFVIAYTGPGGGSEETNTSQGRPSGYDDGRRMFDTLPDARGSWFWGHAMAAMRALTCLETRAEVDASRLGMTGVSAGGVATLLVAGADDRLKAAVPLSASHAWSVAVESPKAWQNGLLSVAGYTAQSPEWARLQEQLIEPGATIAKTTAKVLMINGTTDEFFPLSAHVATYDAIESFKRTSLIGNFDHGCYGLTGIESAGAIEKRRDERMDGGVRAFFHHVFGTDARYRTLPAEPSVSVEAVGSATLVTATVDESVYALPVERVRWWASNDDAFFFGHFELDRQAPGVFAKLVLAPLQENTVHFVDVTYTTRELIAPEVFSLSSRPQLPEGHVPHIRELPESGTAPCQ